MFYRTEGNVVESDVDERDEDESILVGGTGVDTSILDTDEDFEVQPKKKKKKNTFEEKLLTVLANRRVEDPVTSFLMSLAPQIRSLTQDQQNEVYIEFIQTIKKVKGSNNARHSQTSYIPPLVNNDYPRPSDHSFVTNDVLYSYPQYPPYHGIPFSSSTSTIPTSAVQTNSHSANFPYYSQLNYPSSTPSSTFTSTPPGSNNNNY